MDNGRCSFFGNEESASLEELKASFTVAEFPKPGSVTTGVEWVIKKTYIRAGLSGLKNSTDTSKRGELKPTYPLPTQELNSMQDYPPNLSILLSGGKETNEDGPSNGEWSGHSLIHNPALFKRLEL